MIAERRCTLGPSLVEWLHTAAPARTVYAHPPLALALCQVRFASKFGLGDSIAGAFQKAIQVEYPIPERQQQQLASLSVVGAPVQIGFQTEPSNALWKFTDLEGNWTVSLTQDFVTIETRAYAHFDDFINRLRRVLQALIETVEPGLGRRIGLRYINEIRSTELAWTDIVRPELLGVLAIEPFRVSCDQAVQLLSLRANEAQINMQQGLFPIGSTVVPKAGEQPGATPFYLLDIDMFQQFDPPTSLEMDATKILEYVRVFHATISELFRWATRDEYRASLGDG